MKKNIKKNHLLVIGGTGFIGHHILNYGKKSNWKLTSISRRIPKHDRRIYGVKYLILDIKKHELFKKKINNNFTHVVNVAGISGKVFDRKKFIYYEYLKSIKFIMNFFCKKEIKKFIQIGSASEYGSLKTPQKENLISHPKTNYGKANLSATKYLIKLSKINSFPGIAVRLFQVYGKNQNEYQIIPYVIKKTINKEKIKLSGGSQTRDFCHIDDVVKAIFKLLNTKKYNGEIFNIASGRDISIKNLVKLIINEVGFGEPKFGEKNIKKDEIYKSKASIMKIKKLINWNPKINLKFGIRKLIKKYK